MAVAITARQVNTVAGNTRLRLLRVLAETTTDVLEVGGGGQRMVKMGLSPAFDISVGVSREADTAVDKSGDFGEVTFSGIQISAPVGIFVVTTS